WNDVRPATRSIIQNVGPYGLRNNDDLICKVVNEAASHFSSRNRRGNHLSSSIGEQLANVPDCRDAHSSSSQSRSKPDERVDVHEIWFQGRIQASKALRLPVCTKDVSGKTHGAVRSEPASVVLDVHAKTLFSHDVHEWSIEPEDDVDIPPSISQGASDELGA